MLDSCSTRESWATNKDEPGGVARRSPKLTILPALQAKLDTGAIPNLPLVEIMV
jgi:hypothetical protein